MSSGQQDGPVTAATADLVAWLGEAAGVPVRVAPPPGTEAAEPGLVAWPLELRPDQEARGGGHRLPMRLLLRCLVCPTGGIDEANRLLDRVLVAAAAAERAVVLEPPSPQVWLAFGATPRPVLLFDVPIQIDRPTPRAPLVRQPLVVRETPMLSLRGRVVGPGDIPLGGMRVEVASTGEATRTDAHGQFVLAGVPAGEPARLRLRGRGRHLLADFDTPPAEPVVIHCNFEEV